MYILYIIWIDPKSYLRHFGRTCFFFCWRAFLKKIQVLVFCQYFVNIGAVNVCPISVNICRCTVLRTIRYYLLYGTAYYTVLYDTPQVVCMPCVFAVCIVFVRMHHVHTHDLLIYIYRCLYIQVAMCARSLYVKPLRWQLWVDIVCVEVRSCTSRAISFAMYSWSYDITFILHHTMLYVVWCYVMLTLRTRPQHVI